MPKQSDTLRDRSRDAEHKARALSRRADRRAKSARLFLAFAFPASLDSFGHHA
jgi:hypothetical protein